ncbi:hypothetical protein HON22_05935 [Candidatus Peregrinibacteria bacterium]|jgi:adenosine kinase|nr:hypothetical protein [Candidatus Peregrinibacteria bacterium]
MLQKIFISGSLAFDIIFSIPEDFRKSIPIENGEIRNFNASYIANEKKEYFGGTGGNISFWIGTQGIKSTLFSAWGKDFEEKGYKKKLEKSGGLIIGTEGKHTAHAYIVSDPKHQQLTIWQPNAFDMNEKQCISDFLSDKEIMSYDYAIFSAGNPVSITKHIEEFRIKNPIAFIIFDPGQVSPFFNKDQFQACCKNSDLLIGNDIEFQHFRKFGIPEKIDTIETHGEKGADIKIISDVFGVKAGNYYIPAEKTKDVVETTGAGDAFRAGLLAGLVKGETILDAAKIGHRLGAKCVALASSQY